MKKLATKSQFDILSPIIVTGSAHTQGKGIIKGVYTRVEILSGNELYFVHFYSLKYKSLSLYWLMEAIHNNINFSLVKLLV